MNSGTRFVALESPQKCRKTVAKVALDAITAVRFFWRLRRARLPKTSPRIFSTSRSRDSSCEPKLNQTDRLFGLFAAREGEPSAKHEPNHRATHGVMSR